MFEKLSFGVVVLQNMPYARLAEQWEYLEGLGFDSVWVTDHFVDPSCPGDPWFDGWSLLAAMAAQTTRIRIGTLVTSMPLRSPAVLAKQAMTVDHISRGRLELGIGPGRARLDHTMSGADVWEPAERTRRFREFAELLDSMLRNPITSYEGRYYRTHEAAMIPAPIQRPRPPLTLAAHGPATLKIAARLADGWNSFGMMGASAQEAVEITRQRSQMLDAYCAAMGRDPLTIRRSFLIGFTDDRPFASPDAFGEFVERYQEIGISEFIFYWMPGAAHPMFSEPGMCVTDRHMLEHIAAKTIPDLHRAAALRAEAPYSGA